MPVNSPPYPDSSTDERSRPDPAEEGHFPIAPTDSAVPASTRARDYFPELDTLRFIAALFVIMFHGYQSLEKLAVPTWGRLTFFYRGDEAVEFFFTLSGFIITYLLLKELKATDEISIKKFYLRRVYRIWPLYFLALILGFSLLSVVYRLIPGQVSFQAPDLPLFLMFLLFLPNYAVANYPVGPLTPLWSIGVEEQFYLCWAPLCKLCRRRIGLCIFLFALFSSLFSIFISFMPASGPMVRFFTTLHFHDMAIGASFAGLLFYYRNRLFNSPLNGRFVQAVVLAFLIFYYTIGLGSDGLGFETHRVGFEDNRVLLHLLLSIAYGYLILNMAGNPKKVVHLNIRPLVYLGRISYGLYMYHAFVDYGLRYGFMKLSLPARLSPLFVALLYLSLLVSISIVVAHLSYRYFESYFLRRKHSYEVKSETCPRPDAESIGAVSAVTG